MDIYILYGVRSFVLLEVFFFAALSDVSLRPTITKWYFVKPEGNLLKHCSTD